MSITQRGTLALAGVLLLAGCNATAAPQPQTPAFDPGPPTVLAGEGRQGGTLEIPSGAQSLVVRIACSDGYWTLDGTGVDLGDLRSGACGGEPANFVVAVPGRGDVMVGVDDDAMVVAEFRFSADPPPYDEALDADCEALSTYLSAVSNAEQGLSLGALDDAGWAELVDEARAALDGMTPSPTIAPLREALSAGLVDPVPGTLLSAESPVSARARNVAGQLCAANGTGLVIMAQYGG